MDRWSLILAISITSLAPVLSTWAQSWPSHTTSASFAPANSTFYPAANASPSAMEYVLQPPPQLQPTTPPSFSSPLPQVVATPTTTPVGMQTCTCEDVAITGTVSVDSLTYNQTNNQTICHCLPLQIECEAAAGIENSERCGDGVVSENEQCDPGPEYWASGCSTNCTLEASKCGNGILDGTEECDDANEQSDDGCSGFCILE